MEARKKRFWVALVWMFAAATMANASPHWNRARHNMRDYEKPVHFRHVIYHEQSELYVMGGRFGVFMTSPDLQTWTPLETGRSADLNGLAQDSTGHVVALEEAGRILDLASHPSAPPVAGADTWGYKLRWVADGTGATGGRYFVLGWGDPPSVEWSADGEIWQNAVVAAGIHKPQWDPQGAVLWDPDTGDPVVGDLYRDWIEEPEEGDPIYHRAEEAVLPIAALLASSADIVFKGSAVRDVAFNGEVYVAPVVSQYGPEDNHNVEVQYYFNFLLRSHDGVHWTKWWADDTISTIGHRYDWVTMDANPATGRLVATDSERIWISDNGMEWQEVYSYVFEGPTLVDYDSTGFRRVRYRDGVWWALGVGGLFVRSDDQGLTWQSWAQHGPYVPNEILRHHDGERWVIFADGGTVLISDRTGQDSQPLPQLWWKRWPTDLPTEVEIQHANGTDVLRVTTDAMAVGWVDGTRRYLASGTQGLTAWSEDGTAWTWDAQNILASTLRGVRYANQRFLLFGDPLSQSSFLGLSTTGDTWSFPSNVGLSCSGLEGRRTCYPDLDFDPERCWVGAPDEAGEYVPAQLERIALYDGVHVDGSYYAVGAGGEVLQSLNARDWRVVRWERYDEEGQLAECNPYGLSTLRTIVYDGAELIAGGDNSWVVLEPNGSSRPWWLVRGDGFSTINLQYGDNHYLAVASDGKLWVSPNARTWFSQGYPFGGPATAVDLLYQRPAEGTPEDAPRWIATRQATGTTATRPPATPVVITSEDAIYWQETTPQQTCVDHLHHVLLGDGGWQLFGDGVLFEQSDFPVPYAMPDAWSTGVDIPLTMGPPGVVENDAFPGGTHFQAAELVDASQVHGTLEFGDDGGFVYTPAPGFTGNAWFSYRITNEVGTSNDVRVSLAVRPDCRPPPVAVDDAYQAPPGVPVTIRAPGVLANDYVAVSAAQRERANFTAVLLTEVSTLRGTFSLSPTGAVTYQAPEGFTGRETVEYRIALDGELSAPATITFDVAPGRSTPPVAEPDSWVTGVGRQLSLGRPGLLENDWVLDASGTTLSGILLPATVVAALDDVSQANGTVQLHGDGGFSYEPASQFEGTARFTYRLSDGVNHSAPAEVTIAVRAGGVPPPSTVADAVTTAVDVPVEWAAPGVLANDANTEGATVQWDTAALPAEVVFTAVGQGGFRVEPAAGATGTYEVFYKAMVDGQSSAWTALQIDVVEGEQVSVMARADTWNVGPGQTLVLPGPGVLANDGVWAPALGREVSAVEDIAHFSVRWSPTAALPGDLSTTSDGGIVYEAPTDWQGAILLAYTALYGAAESFEAVVVINVMAHPQPLPPIAKADLFQTGTDLPLTITAPGVTANDAGSVTGMQWVFTGPVPGTATGQVDGGLSYVPRAGWEGDVVLWYRALNQAVASIPAPVTVRVTEGAHPPPVAVADLQYVTDVNTVLEENDTGVLANDWVVGQDGVVHTGTGVQEACVAELVDGSALRGHLTWNGDGTFHYTPPWEFEGTEQFSYRLVYADEAAQASMPVAVSIRVAEGAGPGPVPEPEPDPGSDPGSDPEPTPVPVSGKDSKEDYDGPAAGSCFIQAAGAAPGATWPPAAGARLFLVLLGAIGGALTCRKDRSG